MGLESFETETDGKSGSIKTRKKLKNVNLDRRFYEKLCGYNARHMYLVANHTDEAGAKAVVQYIDEVMEDGVDGYTEDEDRQEELATVREEIIEDLL
jgi:hypothetical protein